MKEFEYYKEKIKLYLESRLKELEFMGILKSKKRDREVFYVHDELFKLFQKV